MERFTGLIGLWSFSAWPFSCLRTGRRYSHGSCSGDRPAVRLCFSGAEDGLREAVSDRIHRGECAARIRGIGQPFLFGPLGEKSGPYGVIFAFQVLPIVIFIAALFAILYQIGVMQVVVRAMAARDAAGHGRERSRVHQCRGKHLHGADRSAADDRPFLAGLTNRNFSRS